MNNSTSLSIISSQLLVQTTTSEFWERAQAAYVEELRQCQLFKIGSKGSKNTSNTRKYSWYLILAQSLLQSSWGYLWSTAEPTQSRAEQSMIRGGQKGGSKRGEWDVELQGESLLDSKAAAQDFSHAALLCSSGIHKSEFIACDNDHSHKFLCREGPYPKIHPLVVIHI